MLWFEYRSCNYFFWQIEAPDRATADAILQSHFRISLTQRCFNCRGVYIEEVEQMLPEDVATMLSEVQAGAEADRMYFQPK